MLTRTIAWQHAIAAGDASMRAAGREAWNEDDFAVMQAERDRLDPGLAAIETAELWREVSRRRVAEGRSKRRVLEPCRGCAKQLSAAQRYRPCPHCGARNRGNSSQVTALK